MTASFSAVRPRPGEPGWQPLVLRRWFPRVRLIPQRLLRLPRITTTGLVLTFLALQFLIPARLVIRGMGAVGRPAVAVGLLLAFFWVLSTLRPRGLPAGRQPVRWLLGIYLVVQAIGYAIGMDRVPVPVEVSAGDRFMIMIVAMVGLAMAMADGIRDRQELDRILRFLIGVATAMALVGILQYFRLVDLTQYIRIPGLIPNYDLLGPGSRGDIGLARVAGTANHYIEFGVVLALVLPLALHYALYAPSRRAARWAWFQAGIIVAAIPMSISRSAILTVVVGGLLLASAWKWRLRYNAAVIALVAATALHLLTRGLFGTILGLFRNVDDDPSIQNRLSDQPQVWNLWSQRPVFGRGVGMIIPERYLLIDNEFFVTLIAGGIVGVLAFLALFFVPYLMARSLRLRSPLERDRHLGQALAAALPAACVAAFTFDALSFATYTGLLFVLIGAVGAFWRLQREAGVGPQLRPLTWSPEDRYLAAPLAARDHPRWRDPLLAPQPGPRRARTTPR